MNPNKLQQLKQRLEKLEATKSKKASSLRKSIERIEDSRCEHDMFILKEVRFINGKVYYSCTCIQQGCERTFPYLDNRIYIIDDIRLYKDDSDELKLQENWFNNFKISDYGLERLIPSIGNCFISLSSITDKCELFYAYLSTLKTEWQKVVDSYTPDACADGAYTGISKSLFIKHLNILKRMAVKK